MISFSGQSGPVVLKLKPRGSAHISFSNFRIQTSTWSIFQISQRKYYIKFNDQISSVSSREIFLAASPTTLTICMVIITLKGNVLYYIIKKLLHYPVLVCFRNLSGDFNDIIYIDNLYIDKLLHCQEIITLSGSLITPQHWYKQTQHWYKHFDTIWGMFLYIGINIFIYQPDVRCCSQRMVS